jgi:hypothetical protein
METYGQFPYGFGRQLPLTLKDFRNEAGPGGSKSAGNNSQQKNVPGMTPF